MPSLLRVHVRVLILKRAATRQKINSFAEFSCRHPGLFRGDFFIAFLFHKANKLKYLLIGFSTNQTTRFHIKFSMFVDPFTSSGKCSHDQRDFPWMASRSDAWHLVEHQIQISLKIGFGLIRRLIYSSSFGLPSNVNQF